LLGVCVSFTVRCRGPVRSNTYILLREEDRGKADKKAEYGLVTVVFSGLKAVFALLALALVTPWTWLYVPIGATLALVCAYAFAESITAKRNKHGE